MANSAQTSQIGAPPIQRGAWLDALRFIVACMIVVYHYQEAGPVTLESMHPVFGRGYLLTNFFLIDSGYVLARIYGAAVVAGRTSLADFFSKRVLRLVPMHLLMATTLVGLVLAMGALGLHPRNPQFFDWRELPAQIALVQAYGPFGGKGWNAPAWSISALLGCYLTFPLVLKGARALTGLQALAVAAVGYLVADALAWRFLGFPVYQMPMQYGFLRAAPLFAAGVLLARASETLYIRPRLAAVLGFGAAAGLALVQAMGDFGLASLAMIGLIILAAAAVPVARPSKLVEKAALASFAIFISNEVVRIAWFGVANVVIARLALPEGLQWAVWGAGLVAAVGFGFALYALVDAPSQAWIKARRLGPAALAAWISARLPRPLATDFADFGPRAGYVEVLIAKGGVRGA